MSSQFKVDIEDYRAWLLKTQTDLRSARKLSTGDGDTLDTAIYHTQQAAEKALKGFLIFKKKKLKKVHDLEYLLKLCIEFDDDFHSLKSDVTFLNPYAVAFRYPDGFFYPEKQECDEAIKRARRIFRFVKEKVHFVGEFNLKIFERKD